MFAQLVAFIVFPTSLALAHGEQAPGPHGGKIQMANIIHTEVNPDKDGSFHIFLMDKNIENPTVKNSSLGATIVSGKTKMPLTCSVMGGSHYHCKTKSQRPTTGSLILDANRDGVKAQMTYDLSALAAPAPAAAESPKHDH